MKGTLSDHIRELFEERAMWLRELPDDMPEWVLKAYEEQRPGRLAMAAEIDIEINEAIILMRQLGWLPQKYEMSEPGYEAAE